MNIILIGYRASGKTSVGRRVAELLGCPFYDTDEIVIKTTGRSIRDIVEEGGWSLFREKEKGAVSGLCREDGCVIAFGGGAVLDEDNVNRFSDKGLFIWLRADAETVMNRMRRDGKNHTQRPPLSGGTTWREVSETLRSREEVYRKIAAFAVDTERRSVEEVSEGILNRLRSTGCLNQMNQTNHRSRINCS